MQQSPATLTGVQLTLRGQRAVRVEEREADMRQEQRTAVVEVLVAGQDWVRGASGMVLMLADNRTSGEQAEPLADYGGRLRAYQRALAAARIGIDEPRLAPRVSQISDHQISFTEVTGRLVAAVKERREVTLDVSSGQDFLGIHRDLLVQLEQEALAVFAPVVRPARRGAPRSQ